MAIVAGRTPQQTFDRLFGDGDAGASSSPKRIQAPATAAPPDKAVWQDGIGPLPAEDCADDRSLLGPRRGRRSHPPSTEIHGAAPRDSGDDDTKRSEQELKRTMGSSKKGTLVPQVNDGGVAEAIAPKTGKGDGPPPAASEVSPPQKTRGIVASPPPGGTPVAGSPGPSPRRGQRHVGLAAAGYQAESQPRGYQRNPMPRGGQDNVPLFPWVETRQDLPAGLSHAQYSRDPKYRIDRLGEKRCFANAEKYRCSPALRLNAPGALLPSDKDAVGLVSNKGVDMGSRFTKDVGPDGVSLVLSARDDEDHEATE